MNDFFTETPAFYLEVIIPLALPKNYTWSVPVGLEEKVMTGARVEVILGKNKKYAGIIKRIHKDKPTAFEAKPILNVLDDEPVVFPRQLDLWKWLADYYMCSEGEVMQAAIPTHFKLSSETILIFNEESGEDFSHLDEEEFLVAEALLLKKELRLAEVQQVLDAAHVYPVIKRLIDKKICFVWEELKNNYKEKKESYVVLSPSFNNEESLSQLLNEDKKLQRAEKQMELLLAYLHLIKVEGEVTQPALLQKANASAAHLKGLVDKGILLIDKRTIGRIRYLPKNVLIDFELSTAQKRVLAETEKVFEEKQVCLLHGVTSSGKTLIYIKLMEQIIKEGRQVLYMLPEIALTAQIIRRLQKHFGGYIAVYHSKFNQNERLEIWNKVKAGDCNIVIGARSSIFLPFRELGLVICDEEHDPSYKQQDPAPRYHARDAAIYLASLFNAKVLLGSATPSLESYNNADSGKYGLTELLERYGEVAMPQMQLVDTGRIPNAMKSKTIISPVLQESIEQCLHKHRQVILFQNRRGYAPYQVCQSCGWIPHCKNCDVSLTFHKLSNKLQCHYCGTVYSTVHTCEACGNHLFIQRNFGTERIEEELQELFPQARIARMDVDAVRGKHAHDSLIQAFEQKKLDILVGTQMVVKGLDFEEVDLVGILDGDAILGFTDFRVNERGFQLIEQVSGRAGRKDIQGLVLIQLRNLGHPLIPLIMAHDFKRFFREEMENRKRFFYPPYSRLILIHFRYKDAQIVAQAAFAFAALMKDKFADYMVGPAQPVVNRIRNQYLMELMFKLPKNTSLIHDCKQWILTNTALIHQEKKFRTVQIIADVDAV